MATQLDRRDFLLAASAGAALLPSAARALGPRRAGVAIAYRSPRGGAGDPLGADLAGKVVAAERLVSGEARLARRGARITLHGLVGEVAGLAPAGIRALDLSIRYRVAGARPEVGYRAWSCQLLPVAQQGSANRFTVPADDGLELSLEVETLGVERFESRLVTGRDAGLPKLRSGLYLIAPRAAGFFAARFDPDRGEPLIALSVEAAAS